MHGYWLNTNNFSLHHHFRFITITIHPSFWLKLDQQNQEAAFCVERIESASILLGTTKIQFQTFAYRGQSLLSLPRYSRHGRRWGCSRSSCHSETVLGFKCEGSSWGALQVTWNLNCPHWLFISSRTHVLVTRDSPVAAAARRYRNR